jgi:hypothetical protein
MRDSKGSSITVGKSGSPWAPSITKETPEHANHVAFLPTALTSAGDFGPLRTFIVSDGTSDDCHINN